MGTEGGVFRIVSKAGEAVRFEAVNAGIVPDGSDRPEIGALLEDRRGAIWIAANSGGVYRFWPDGRSERYTGFPVLPSLPRGGAHALLEDPDGSLWIGRSDGLFHFVLGPDGRTGSPRRSFPASSCGWPACTAWRSSRAGPCRCWAWTAT